MSEANPISKYFDGQELTPAGEEIALDWAMLDDDEQVNQAKKLFEVGFDAADKARLSKLMDKLTEFMNDALAI